MRIAEKGKGEVELTEKHFESTESCPLLLMNPVTFFLSSAILFWDP